jgi:hypothetical protein
MRAMSSRALRTVVVPSLFFLCALAPAACGPSIDAAAKADIDARVAALQPSNAVVPPPAGTQPMPLAPGQWSQYKLTDGNGQPSFTTYKVLGVEGDAFWIEILHESYTGRSGQKMLLALGNRMDPNQIDIRQVVTLDRRGNVNPMPPAMLPLLQSTFRSVVAQMVFNWQGLSQEGVTVPAGRFEGCFHTRSEGQWGTWKSTADSWSHPAVPVSGVVRSQGVDHPFTMELVAFGLSGATPDF